MIRKPLPFVIVCLLFVVGVPFYSVAQAGLALTLQNYTVQPASGQVGLGYTITINADLTNTDTVDFVGQIDFGLRNNSADLTTTPTNIFSAPYYSFSYSNQNIAITPGETVPAIFSVDVESPYFAPGPDVVVVWPISNKPIADSIVISLVVVGPNTLMGQPEAEITYLVLTDRIVLQDVPSASFVQQVRIYNVYGQLMSGIQTNGFHEIILGNLPKGIYLCEVTLANRSKKVIKFSH